MGFFWNNWIFISSIFNKNWSWDDLNFWQLSTVRWRIIFISRILDSRIFWSYHNASLLGPKGIRHSIFNLVQVIGILIFNSRIVWSHKWFFGLDFFLGSEFRFNGSVLVWSFDSREDWSSHQTCSFTRSPHWRFVVEWSISDTTELGSIKGQHGFGVSFFDIRGIFALIINTLEFRTGHNELSRLFFHFRTVIVFGCNSWMQGQRM